MLATSIKSLTHYAKGITLQNNIVLLRMLVSNKFQDIFKTFDIVTFHLSLTIHSTLSVFRK